MKKWLLTAVALTVLAGPAMAADLAVRAAPPAYKAPPPVAVFTWTGCYVGVNGGYGWQREHNAELTVSNGGFFPGQALNPNGGFGGGQVGCNYQVGAFVWGVEGDFQGSGIRSSWGPTVFNPGVAQLTVTASEKLSWFGTIRGRAGFAMDRVLLYVTGGAAWGKTAYNIFAFDGGNSTVTVNGDTTRTGYAVGAGIEWAFFGGWTAKAEYQYLNFGSIGPLTGIVLNAAGVPNGVTVLNSGYRNDYHTFRVGLNYLFNAGPVVARY